AGGGDRLWRLERWRRLSAGAASGSGHCGGGWVDHADRQCQQNAGPPGVARREIPRAKRKGGRGHPPLQICDAAQICGLRLGLWSFLTGLAPSVGLPAHFGLPLSLLGGALLTLGGRGLSKSGLGGRGLSASAEGFQPPVAGASKSSGRKPAEP